MNRLLRKIHIPTWLCILLSLVLILRIPSFFEPYSYGDEMVYLTLAEGVRQGIPLYKGLHDNKPPLLYLAAALAGNLFWFKAILAFWNLATVILFYKLLEALFPKKEALQKVGTVIFGLLTTLPLLEGNIVNAEMFMIGPAIAAFLILLTKNLNFKNLFFAGVLFSLAALFKIPAAFDIPAIIVYWLIQSGTSFSDLKIILKRTFYLALGFILPIFLTFIWYFWAGALKEYFVAAFLQNLGYLSSFRPQDVARPFLARNAPLIFRGLIVFVGSAILYVKRNRLSSQFIFITLWLLFSLFAVTLSERPYPHYLIQSAAPISLLFGMLFADKTLEQSLAIIPLALAFFVPVYYKFYYYPTVPYYLRFIKFATGKIDKREYFNEFDGKVVRTYEISDFLVKSSRPTDKVFVWGDSPPIYALSKRLPPIKYVADYHIHDFSTPSQVIGALYQNKPKFIVVLPDAPSFPELLPFLERYYAHTETIAGANIWLLLVQ